MCNSDWNLEQMQRDIEQNHNGLDDGSLSTDSNLDEDLDYDSEQTLPPVQCSDNGSICSLPIHLLKSQPFHVLHTLRNFPRKQCL